MHTPLSIGNAEHYRWGDNCDGWYLLNRDDLRVIQERVPAGRSEQMHYHHYSRQFFYVLRGNATLVIGKETVVVKEQEGLEVPPGVPHQLRNDTQADLEFIVISAPESHGDRVNVD
jgi:mannose-6-phosphate isomerase-like protein (cupin superfamily)